MKSAAISAMGTTKGVFVADLPLPMVSESGGNKHDDFAPRNQLVTAFSMMAPKPKREGKQREQMIAAEEQKINSAV